MVMEKSDVTVVVVPRERFSHAIASLDSIERNNEAPFELLYVDGHGPRELDRRAADGRLRLIRRGHSLSPNAARNLALPHVTTKYLVFVDNDVIVSPGWLGALVACAEMHDATAVCPLTFEDEAFNVVHHAGGELLWKSMGQGRRWLTERRPRNHLPLVKVNRPPVAGPTELNDFHGVLVRTDFFAQNGPLDEGLLSMAEETDFSIAVAQSGGSMMFEPASRVSDIPPPPEPASFRPTVRRAPRVERLGQEKRRPHGGQAQPGPRLAGGHALAAFRVPAPPCLRHRIQDDAGDGHPLRRCGEHGGAWA
jgi:GT2 family glycosyltransferase